jgi:myo-inositol-1(or 4)-monophosphatase
MARSALLNVMVQAAMKAGRRLSRDIGEVENLQVSVKGPGDFVSAADRQAEKIIFEELGKARSNFGFLMEERGEVKGSDPQNRWIVDPLDGTTNFLHGIPVFAISIALEREGQIIAALVYNPVMDELFTAEKGKGAFLNDKRLRVANRREMSDCVFATGIPHLGKPAHGDYLEQQSRVMRNASGVRRFGAAAIDLCYVAAGRFDGFWETGLSPWDMAAGILMIREAGGFVTDFSEGQDMFGTTSIVAGNEIIRRRLLATVLGEA